MPDSHLLQLKELRGRNYYWLPSPRHRRAGLPFFRHPDGTVEVGVETGLKREDGGVECAEKEKDYEGHHIRCYGDGRPGCIG